MNTKRLTFISLFSAILCVICPIALPVGTIPVTLSIFGIFVTAVLLPKFDGAIATLIYIILGIVGLPVFSGYTGGFGVITGITGGFIISYPVIAIIISLLKKHSVILSLFISLLVSYSFGALWFFFISGVTLKSAIITSVVPFIIPDIIKLFCALFISKSLKKACASFYELG